MTNKFLFESMSSIEDELLEKSERKAFNWQKFAVAAACICLVTAAAEAVIPKLIGEGEIPPIINIENQLPIPNAPIQPDTPNLPDTPIVPTIPDEPSTPIEPDVPVEPKVSVLPNTPSEPDFLPDYLFDTVYNDVEDVLAASRPNIPHYFTEELSESELKSLELIFKEDWMNFSGFAGFGGEGELLEIRMSTPTTVPDVEIQIAVSEALPVTDYVFGKEAQVSKIGSVEVKMYRYEMSETNILFEVYGVMDRANVGFSVVATRENEDAVKKDLETLVYLYANYFNSDRLDEVTAESIPEYRNEQITLSESYNDADFGAYMPKKLPDGFTEEAVRRYKNYQLNYLSGLWTKGYSQISWQVSYLAEGDELRFTTVEAVENYDLSLYPIPMAESVSEELREIVDHPIFDLEDLTLDVVYARSRNIKEAGDVSGYRTSFDVRIGEIVIRISTKGVSPEWVYDSLKAFVG